VNPNPGICPGEETSDDTRDQYSILWRSEPCSHTLFENWYLNGGPWKNALSLSSPAVATRYGRLGLKSIELMHLLWPEICRRHHDVILKHALSRARCKQTACPARLFSWGV
jgi:hypothetical protein